MKHNATLLLVILYVIASPRVLAKDTLKLVEVHDMILTNHPLIQQANLFGDIAEAYVLKGRGALDPKLSSSFDGKQFKDTNYFRKWNTEVKIPTRYPVDLSLGYESNSGDFLDLESFLPTNGLAYGTLNISLLRGLLFDEQRYNLQMAQVQGIKSRIEQESLIREVVTQGMMAYLDWATANAYYDSNLEYQTIINERHLNIIDLYLNGDKPAIDTLESRINLNTARKHVLDAESNLLIKQQKLELFLWSQTGEPLQLLDNTVPEALAEVVDYLKLQGVFIKPNFENDPTIRKKDNAVNALSLDNRLLREQRKPQLDLKYNTIVSLGSSNLALTSNINDYKVGASLEIPILNRKANGLIQLNEAITEQTTLDRKYSLSKLDNTYTQLNNNLEILGNILEINNQKILDSRTLYDAELLKFGLGESSVFLLNQRERKLLEARIEAIKGYKSLGQNCVQLYYLKLGQE